MKVLANQSMKLHARTLSRRLWVCLIAFVESFVSSRKRGGALGVVFSSKIYDGRNHDVQLSGTLLCRLSKTLMMSSSIITLDFAN
jgi:hypothetical protein